MPIPTRCGPRLGMALALAALAWALPAAARAEPQGAIVIATPTLSQHVDPTTTLSTDDYINFDHLYDGLINLGAEGKYPALAESWTISADGKQIDFKLRKNVKFHNGDPFTAEDVKFTIDRLLAPDSTHSYRTGFQTSIERVDVVDPHVARFVLKQPWPAFFSTGRYGLQQIVPKKYYESVGARGFAEKPIGTGPFKLAQRKAGEWTKFEAYAGYWGGAPKVKDVTITMVKEPFTRYAMLDRGEADIVSSLTGPLLDRVRKNGEFRIVISKYSGTTGLMFNKTLFPQAEDRRIRLAVAHAMNREQYASKILGGICEPATSILTPATFGFLPGLPQIAYDPAKAKALLTEAGIKPGMKVTFTLHTEAFSALPSAPLLLEAIAGDLQAVGFEVERQPVDSSAWISMMRAQKQPMIYYSPSGQPDDGGELINTWFASHSAWSSRSINRAEYDALFKEQIQESNLEKRTALLQKFARMEHENIENIPVLWCGAPFVVGKRVKNWMPGLSSSISLNTDQLELK